MPKPTESRKKLTKAAPSKEIRAKGVEPLVGRNILLHGQRRTSMRLEPSMWTALEEIAAREGMQLGELCSRIDDRLAEQARQRGLDPEESEVTLSSGVRVFIFAYYRAAATETGHKDAGHGMGDPFKETPFERKDPQDKSEGAGTDESECNSAPATGLLSGGSLTETAGAAAA